MIEIYKKGQGTAARALSAVTLGAFAVFGCTALYDQLSSYGWATDAGVSLGGALLTWNVIICAVFILAGAVLVAMLLNYKRFVDYLINSETELRKVSWPTRPELKRQATVVIVTLALFGFLLFVVDMVFGYGSRLLFLVQG